MLDNYIDFVRITRWKEQHVMDAMHKNSTVS